MGNLNEHFRQSGYTLHRAALRKERLPRCCRGHLRASDIGVKFLDGSGGEEVLPLTECTVCGSRFAVCGDRYVAVKNLLQFEVVPLPK